MATKKVTTKKTTTRTKTTTKKTVTRKPKTTVVKEEPKVEVKTNKRFIKKKYVVFLCLYGLFFVLYSSMTSFAKFASVVSQSGSIAVAKWDVSLSGEDNAVFEPIVIGDDSTYQDYTLTVTSNSEVALSYSVVLTNVPDDLIVLVGDEAHRPTNNRITINNIGSFTALDNNRTHTHTLTFIVPIDSDAFDSQTIDIDVMFSQEEL